MICELGPNRVHKSPVTKTPTTRRVEMQQVTVHVIRTDQGVLVVTDNPNPNGQSFITGPSVGGFGVARAIEMVDVQLAPSMHGMLFNRGVRVRFVESGRPFSFEYDTTLGIPTEYVTLRSGSRVYCMESVVSGAVTVLAEQSDGSWRCVDITPDGLVEFVGWELVISPNYKIIDYQRCPIGRPRSPRLSQIVATTSMLDLISGHLIGASAETRV